MTWKEAQEKYGSSANWRHWKMVNCPIQFLWRWLGFIDAKDIAKYG